MSEVKERVFPRQEYLTDRAWRLSRLRARTGWPWVHVPLWFTLPLSVVTATVAVAAVVGTLIRVLTGASFWIVFGVVEFLLLAYALAQFARVLRAMKRPPRRFPGGDGPGGDGVREPRRPRGPRPGLAAGADPPGDPPPA